MTAPPRVNTAIPRSKEQGGMLARLLETASEAGLNSMIIGGEETRHTWNTQQAFLMRTAVLLKDAFK
ncbi:hypothetical protein NDU88_005695 [Pleurodeles waltl]|uniref:Uncharacterized protein n=1 Tax=Pleurodeles waltl TaxID=8319 RepID=A0AAV7VLV5_PLEWA|nr:hypothetical protein NDU88_005695 [Pleurodeles waltl]